MPVVLFHAINGTGVGHVVRLSWIAAAVRQAYPAVAVEVVSSSTHCAEFFDRPAVVVPCDLREQGAHVKAVLACLANVRPDVIVFDTRWPAPVVEAARRAGVRCVLVLRAVHRDRAVGVVERASTSFDSVLVPHAHDELCEYYGAASAIVRRLVLPPFRIVGPIARVAELPCVDKRVILSLGGGGEYPGRINCADRIESMVTLYTRVTEMLRSSFPWDIAFLRGHLLPDGIAIRGSTEVRGSEVYRLLGRSTCVVSRGGYNTCWEAVGAGSRLVLASSYADAEDVVDRCRYFASRGLAGHTAPTPEAIAEAVISSLERPPLRSVVTVNAGLADVVARVIGP